MNNTVVELSRVDHVVPQTLGTLLGTRDVHVLDSGPGIGHDWCMAGVEVHGDVVWEMTLSMPHAVARRLAGAMLWSNVVQVDDTDAEDAAKELVSIVASGCRDVDDRDSWMGLPTVRDSLQHRGGTLEVDHWFAWGYDVLCFTTRVLGTR